MATEPRKYFFSYARADKDFALRLAKDLRASGADVWIDALDIRPGKLWDVEVEKALHASAGVIAILSPRAVSSKNVMDEVSWALGQDYQVIPVLSEPCEIPYRLQRRQFADFTSDYETGIASMRSALELGVPEPPESAAPAETGRKRDKADAPQFQQTASRDSGVEIGTVRKRRIRVTLAGALAGVVAGLAFVLMYRNPYRGLRADEVLIAFSITIVCGAIAGYISAGQKLAIRVALSVAIASLLAGFLAFLGAQRDAVVLLALYGTAGGAVLGSIAGRLWGRYRNKAGAPT